MRCCFALNLASEVFAILPNRFAFLRVDALGGLFRRAAFALFGNGSSAGRVFACPRAHRVRGLLSEICGGYYRCSTSKAMEPVLSAFSAVLFRLELGFGMLSHPAESFCLLRVDAGCCSFRKGLSVRSLFVPDLYRSRKHGN